MRITCEQLAQRGLARMGDRRGEQRRIEVARPAPGDPGARPRRSRARTGSRRAAPAAVLEGGAGRLDLGDQVALRVAPEDGDAAELAGHGIEPLPSRTMSSPWRSHETAGSSSRSRRSRRCPRPAARRPRAAPPGPRSGTGRARSAAPPAARRPRGAASRSPAACIAVSSLWRTSSAKVNRLASIAVIGMSCARISGRRSTRVAQHRQHHPLARRDHLIAVGEERQDHHQGGESPASRTAVRASSMRAR